MTESKICTCPSGDGSLRWPCPKHPAVEQAGGDERDLQGAQGERDGWGPFPIVQVPWNVFDRAVMWVEDRRRYGDDGTIVDDWKALKTIQRAALAQPSPKCATCNDRGHVCLDWEAGAWEECPDCAQAEAERPEMSSERAAYFMRRFKSEEKLLGPNEQAAVDYVLSLIAQHERIVGDLQRQKHEADTALAWATRHYQTVEQERDAALAKLAELEAKLSDPTAVHQWQFSNAWFDGSEEVVLKAGKEGSPIRTLYAAPVAQAQPEETPGEILAAKLIETWVAKHGKPAPWSTAIEITAVATNMPNDERDRLLALDDDVDAQAQHSVPEEFIGRLSEFLAQRGATGKALLRELRTVLASAPGKEGL
ncbi:hypothetical protein IPC887_16900 [Pseudomonas aeruginosa]|uniref:hypothetical protein n=1 Tax=Pseudomonas aeruginosa TaxID=287 RepID=UPI000FF12E59|nr:hypothetical protein [Pseudomonas aeruginosa]RPU51548.1 hypothetical protein IPC887_16900 [Pseudomonas aeruginosa]